MELEIYFAVSFIINAILLLVVIYKSKQNHQLSLKNANLHKSLSDSFDRIGPLRLLAEKKSDELEQAKALAMEYMTEVNLLNNKIVDADKAIVGFNSLIENQENTIKKLKADLAQAQKNDTPKDPKTGKFTKKKTAVKKVTK